MRQAVSGRGRHSLPDRVGVERGPRGGVEPGGPAGLVGHPRGAEVRAQRGQVAVHLVEGQVRGDGGGGGVDHLGLEAEPPVGEEAGHLGVLVGVLPVPGDELGVVQALGRRAEHHVQVVGQPGLGRVTVRVAVEGREGDPREPLGQLHPAGGDLLVELGHDLLGLALKLVGRQVPVARRRPVALDGVQPVAARGDEAGHHQDLAQVVVVPLVVRLVGNVRRRLAEHEVQVLGHPCPPGSRHWPSRGNRISSAMG